MDSRRMTAILALAGGVATLTVGAQAQDRSSAARPIPVPERPDVALTLRPLPDAGDPTSLLTELAGTHGGVAEMARPVEITVDGESVQLRSATFRDAHGRMHMVFARPGDAAACHMERALRPVAAGEDNRPIMQACLAALRAGPGGSASAPAPRAERTQAAPTGEAPAPDHAVWSQVDGVYFISRMTFGVGGMMVADFRPVILFKDGAYFEIGDTALEDVDLARSRRADPDNWGRWTRQGDRFVLTDSDGDSDDHELQQGTFFKAFPAESRPLAGPYESVGGGGDTALGGSVIVASHDLMVFGPGERFSTRRSTGALNTGGNTGVSSSASARRGGEGRFSVSNHTLTLIGPDGREERRFFAYGSEGTPARPDADMLFVGDTVYTSDDD